MSAIFFTSPIRRGLLVWALFICALPATGKKQGKELIDSLQQILPTVSTDTTRIRLLCRLGIEYSYIDPDAGIRYASQALTLASQKDWKKGIASAYNILGICENYKADFRRVMLYWERALAIYRQTGDKAGIVKVIGNIGAFNMNQGHYAKALDNYFEALKTAEDIADQRSIAINLGNIGATYNYLRNNKKSLEYYEKAVALFVSLDDKQSAAIFLADMGHVYREEQKYVQALQYADSSLKLSEAIGDNQNIIRSITDIGSLYNDKHDYTRALDFLNRALSMARKNEFKPLEAVALTQLGEVFLGLAKDSSSYKAYITHLSGRPALPHGRDGLLRTAAGYFRQSITIDSGSASLNALRINYTDLSEALKISGQYQEALMAYEKAAMLRDSIFSTESKLKVTNLESQRELELKDKQIEINRLEVAKKRNERVFFIIGIGLLLAVGVILFRNIRLRNAKQLSEGKLSAFQARMNPHFIFNSLNSIQSLVLNSETVPAITYLSRFSKLMRQILDSSAKSKVLLQTELEMLRGYIELEQLRFDRFRYELAVAPDISPEGTELPAMIIQPFVENAIIHGILPKRDEGVLIVSFTKGEGCIICTIDDNGIGRKASAALNAERRKEHESHGISIAANRLALLSKSVKGGVTYIDKEAGGIATGTTVILNIPTL